MKFKKITAFVTSIVMLSILTVSNTCFAEDFSADLAVSSEEVTESTEKSTYTVTFLGYSGEQIAVQEVSSETAIDYSVIDTSSATFNYNVDTFTQRKFFAWDIQPETVQQNTVIQALYSEFAISIASLPEKTVYHSMDEEIDRTGLVVNITVSTPSDQFDENNNRIFTSEVVDVSSTCTFSADNTSLAFAESNSAEIKIYPISSIVPVGTYQISFEPIMGDANLDGQVNASDSSEILLYYAKISMGLVGDFTENQKKVSDMNGDSQINSSDASDVLAYYAEISSGK